MKEMMPQAVSLVLIRLLKGVLYQDKNPAQWRDLLIYQGTVLSYFAAIGLHVVIDESEGYAFLQQTAEIDEGDDGNTPQLPRLVQRRQLSYPVSLLLVLLRKKLIEQDTTGEETRVILSREQIVDLMRVFLPDSENEAKIITQIDSHIRKVSDYGFLRRLTGDEERYEIRRIIKALIDADWLSDFNQKLEEYQDHAATLS